MRIVRAIQAFALLTLAVSVPLSAAPAQDNPGDPMAARLSAEKAGDVETGDYSAGDNVLFSLDSYGGHYLLRFAGAPERYVLSVERVALGGRILLYDTGATALRVSVWGGMTLYTVDAPGGLPATRIGDSSVADRPSVSRADLAQALADAQNHFAYADQMHLRFDADAAVLAGGDDARGQAFDALVSTLTGLDRLVTTAGAKQVLLKKFDAVKIAPGDKPGVTASGKTLLVTFTPGAGPAGRASSREVTFALGKLLSVPEPG